MTMLRMETSSTAASAWRMEACVTARHHGFTPNVLHGRVGTSPGKHIQIDGLNYNGMPSATERYRTISGIMHVKMSKHRTNNTTQTLNVLFNPSTEGMHNADGFSTRGIPVV